MIQYNIHNIVKYRNRKLYSKTLNRYIKLTSNDIEEITIETLLDNNIDFEVTEEATGIDITNSTIASLINIKLKQNPRLSLNMYDFMKNNHIIENVL